LGPLAAMNVCVQAASSLTPFNLFQSEELPQFLMLGLEKAGKTTLLYRLRVGVGGWNSGEITRCMAQLRQRRESGDCKDPAYHYEELRSNGIGRYGIWEIPGDEVMMDMWPMFYRFLNITAVFFVVDAFSADKGDIMKIAQAKQQMEILLHEDELRFAAFVLVINSAVTKKEQQAGKSEEHEKSCRDFESALEEMLGVPEIRENPAQKIRFLKCSINCAGITREDPAWESLLRDIRKVSKGVDGAGLDSGLDRKT